MHIKRCNQMLLCLLLSSSLLAITITSLSVTASLAQTQETAIVVDTFDDELDDGGDDCSLREAIQAANTNSAVDGCPAGHGDDAILLPAGNYTLTLPGTNEDTNSTGDLDIISGTVLLMGTGPERTVIDGNRLDRVLHIHNGVAVEIHGIRITGGKTLDGYPGGSQSWGGGIYNDGGSLLLAHSAVVSNATGAGEVPYIDGGHGGGIYSSGVLTLDHTLVVSNATGQGGGEDLNGYAGNGGSGGGIYNQGSLALFSSTIGDNSTGDGGMGGEGGDGGLGGGLYNSGVLNLMHSTIERNRTGRGETGWWLGGTGGLGGGIYSSNTLTVSNSIIFSNTCGGGGGGPAGYGARGGAGGGLYVTGTTIVTRSVVLSNISGEGGWGDYGSGGGRGGGIYNDGTLVVGNSSIQDNATGDGAYSHFGPHGNGGGSGGGVYNGGTLDVFKSTISGNTTGDGGTDPYDEGSDGGRGGGICNNGVLTVTDSTISGNTTGDGSEGEYGNSGHGGGIANYQALAIHSSTVNGNTAGSIVVDGVGGGIHNRGAFTVGNTILAGNIDVNGPGDCHQEYGVLKSQGYNLVEAVGTCVFTATGDLTGIHLLLAPLGDNGGDTLTHALLPGSPAIDQGSCRTSLTDQRGFPRPLDLLHVVNADDGCDIGAFEYCSGYYIYLPLVVRDGAN